MQKSRTAQRSKVSRQPQIQKKDLDVFDVFAIVYFVFTAILLFMLITLYQDVTLGPKVVMVVSMLITGLVGRMAIRYISPTIFDTAFDDFDAEKMAIGMSIGITGISMIQFIVLQASVINASFTTGYEATLTMAFFIGVAVSEEFFFRFFVYAIFKALFKNITLIPGFIISNIVTSAIFMVFHLSVYSASSVVLLTVFFSSVILCFIYEYTKRISVTLTIHVFINAVASGYFMYVFTGGGLLG